MKLTEEQQEQHEKWGFEFTEEGQFSQVRTNLMADKNYRPYCMICDGLIRLSKFDGEQFSCYKGHRTEIPKEFINRFKQKHNL